MRVSLTKEDSNATAAAEIVKLMGEAEKANKEVLHLKTELKSLEDFY